MRRSGRRTHVPKPVKPAYGYFRHKHTDLEPIGVVCHQDGLPLRTVQAALDSGEIDGTRHEQGGWFLTTAQRQALHGWATERGLFRTDL